MIFYDYKRAPNARRVRVFLAEKNITVETVDVSLETVDQLKPEYLEITDRAVVPALRLDDGTVITESIAICRYFEEIQPEPSLFGRDAMERVAIEMWNRQMELEGMLPVAEAVRNENPFFKNRALPGQTDFPQIPDLAERGKQRTRLFYDLMEQRLAETPWLGGEIFSVADITAICAMDFAKVVKIQPGDSHPHVLDWRERVNARPSARA